MSSDEKYAKLLALVTLYEKRAEQGHEMQLQRISCRMEDINPLLNNIHDEGFKSWVQSVSHLFKR